MAFAPNPFMGACSLATCKPRIRARAQVGDWIVGTGSAARNHGGRLVFVMRVSEALTFNQYWNDPRFQAKKPNLRGSKKVAFGDNIYCRNSSGTWQQINSHHSLADGSRNDFNVKNDTQTDRVLIATEFVYWGGSGPKIPATFRNYDGFDICAKRGHKRNFPQKMVTEFLEWLQGMDARGFVGDPLDWERTP